MAEELDALEDLDLMAELDRLRDLEVMEEMGLTSIPVNPLVFMTDSRFEMYKQANEILNHSIKQKKFPLTYYESTKAWFQDYLEILKFVTKLSLWMITIVLVLAITCDEQKVVQEINKLNIYPVKILIPLHRVVQRCLKLVNLPMMFTMKTAPEIWYKAAWTSISKFVTSWF